jgi:hypothetical protein
MCEACCDPRYAELNPYRFQLQMPPDLHGQT